MRGLRLERPRAPAGRLTLAITSFSLAAFAEPFYLTSMRAWRRAPLLACGLLCLGAPAALAQLEPVVMRPHASGQCACDFSKRVLNHYVITPNSDFGGTRAVEATMRGLVAAGVKLSRADFSSAVLTDARFTGSILRQVQFRNAKLHNSDFTRADLSGADFSGADLSGADLETASGLTAAQLEDACGDARTKLPIGLSVPLCPSAEGALPTADETGPVLARRDTGD